MGVGSEQQVDPAAAGAAALTGAQAVQSHVEGDQGR